MVFGYYLEEVALLTGIPAITSLAAGFTHSCKIFDIIIIK